MVSSRCQGVVRGEYGEVVWCLVNYYKERFKSKDSICVV